MPPELLKFCTLLELRAMSNLLLAFQPTYQILSVAQCITIISSRRYLARHCIVRDSEREGLPNELGI